MLRKSIAAINIYTYLILNCSPYLLSISQTSTQLRTMAAQFIPPTADLGVTAVPGAGAGAGISLPVAAPEPEAHTIPAVPGEPRPVAPAEDIGVPPAKALDPVAEQSILDKAREVTKPVRIVSPFFSDC